MSVINKLHIHNFRNFHNQYVEFNNNINLFIADNAHGKTNLIEAIYYLAHNRSFKTKNIKELIKFNKNEFLINANTNNQQIKFIKSLSKTNISINYKNINNTSQLTKSLPIQLITPDKGFIVNGTPKNKRSYLDWGVFHVEPDISKEFKKYNKILKNINTLLHDKHKQDIDFWLFELSKTAAIINQARFKYIQQLNKNTNHIINDLFNNVKSFNYSFLSGWVKSVDSLNFNSIFNYLINNKNDFFKKKYLNCGSHKASIKFILNSKDECFLSRGEQKNLSIIFWLSQILMLIELNIKPIVLIDDLSSELDNLKIQNILNYLDTLNVQTIITNINNNLSLSNKQNTQVFSIKNGLIKPCL